MEAHAKQEWPLGNRRSNTAQHRNLADRIAAARQFQCQHDSLVLENVHFTVDTMENTFYSSFGAWPETHLVIDGNGRLELRTESELGEGTLRGGEWDDLVEEALEKLLK